MEIMPKRSRTREDTVAMKVYFDRKQYEELKAFAYKQGMSMSAFVIRTLMAWRQLQLEKAARLGREARMRDEGR